MWAPPRGPPFGRQKLVGTIAVGPTSGLPCGNKKLVGTSAVGTTSVDQGRLWCHQSRLSWHPGRSKSPRSKSTFQGSFQWRPPHWRQGGPIQNPARNGIALRREVSGCRQARSGLAGLEKNHLKQLSKKLFGTGFGRSGRKGFF